MGVCAVRLYLLVVPLSSSVVNTRSSLRLFAILLNHINNTKPNSTNQAEMSYTIIKINKYK